jgi:hypothetical protein
MRHCAVSPLPNALAKRSVLVRGGSAFQWDAPPLIATAQIDSIRNNTNLLTKVRDADRGMRMLQNGLSGRDSGRGQLPKRAEESDSDVLAGEVKFPCRSFRVIST